jgi:hypothetical protein
MPSWHDGSSSSTEPLDNGEFYGEGDDFNVNVSLPFPSVLLG